MRVEPADIDGLRPILKELARELLAEIHREQADTQLSAPIAQHLAASGELPRLAYSEAEAAAMLGVERHVLREQRRMGRITFAKGPGRRILYRPSDLEAYLRRGDGGAA